MYDFATINSCHKIWHIYCIKYIESKLKPTTEDLDSGHERGDLETTKRTAKLKGGQS